MTDLVRQALVESGLPLKADGTPLVAGSVLVNDGLPRVFQRRDGEYEVSYNGFEGGALNGSWGHLNIGGGWIQENGEVVDYEHCENGCFCGPLDVADYFWRAIVIAQLRLRDPASVDVLQLLGLGEMEREEVVDWLEAGVLEGCDLEALIDDAAQDIWGLIGGMSAIELDLDEHFVQLALRRGHVHGEDQDLEWEDED